MKTINTLIKYSTVGTLKNPYRYGVIFLFSGIVIIAVSLLTFMLNNISHMSASFNF